VVARRILNLFGGDLRLVLVDKDGGAVELTYALRGLDDGVLAAAA
jgi:hypothetical protein